MTISVLFLCFHIYIPDGIVCLHVIVINIRITIDSPHHIINQQSSATIINHRQPFFTPPET
jgi:hypothetical protein